jgi:hypothetical protein
LKYKIFIEIKLHQTLWFPILCCCAFAVRAQAPAATDLGGFTGHWDCKGGRVSRARDMDAEQDGNGTKGGYLG